MREVAWVSGKINGLPVDFMLDTGAAVTAVSKEVFDQAFPEANLQESNVQLVLASGEPLKVIGKTEMILDLGHLQVTFPVTVIDNFRFQCLLGNDFLAKHGLRIQYDTKTVVFSDGKCVPFFQLAGKRSAFLCTDVLVPPERAMVIQAKINGDEEGLLLFAERQPGKSATKIHVASVLTKCRKSGRVALEIMNATKSPVQLKQGDEMAELELFQEIKAEQVKDKTKTVIRPSDLNIGHLSTEEQQHLCHVLNESGVAGQKRLGRTFVYGEAVVAYASRQLSSSERNYSTIQKECLAILWALQYFHHYLFGRTFVIVTDHRSLKWLQTMKPKSGSCSHFGITQTWKMQW